MYVGTRSRIPARVADVPMIVTPGKAERYSLFPRLWSGCQCEFTTKRTGLSVSLRISAICRRVEPGMLPVSNTSTPLSPTIAIEFPDWNPVRSSGVMNAYTPSATRTVRYVSTEGYEAAACACALPMLATAAMATAAHRAIAVKTVVDRTGEPRRKGETIDVSTGVGRCAAGKPRLRTELLPDCPNPVRSGFPHLRLA